MIRKAKINLLLVSAAVLALNSLLISGGIWFFRSELSYAYFKARSHVLELKIIDKELNVVGELRASVREARDDIILLRDMFFEREDVASFLEVLEKMASMRNLEITINAAEIVDGQRFSALFRFSLKGSFSDVAAFVTMIENAPYFAELEEISINKVGRAEVRAYLIVQAQ